MKRLYIAQKVRPTAKYLGVQVRIEVGSTIRWAEVKVPWRLLNERYEDIGNYMGAEANEAARDAWAPADTLPLEKWE